MNKIKSVIRRSLLTRPRIAPLLVIALAVSALGAKCIDRTSTYVDSDGYTHITGEMVNDTNIQGTNIMLQGTLLDDAGNVVATKTAPTCPPDTQPHQQTAFDIRFDNPNVPPWTHFEVRPISGKALDAPLPDPKVVMFFSDAIRYTAPYVTPDITITPNDVFFVFRVRNQSTTRYPAVQACAAVFDQGGNIVFVNTSELVAIDNAGHIQPGSLDANELTDLYWNARNVPKGPVQVKVWLWFGEKGAPTSAYEFVTTGLISIRSVAP